MDRTDTTRGDNAPPSDWGIFGHDPSPFVRNDPNADKPIKAAWGLGMLLVISLALYGFNAAHHSHAASAPTSEATMHAYNNAHFAPREDNSIQN
jgi:hypothetical protein